jgi:hypothetical protein
MLIIVFEVLSIASGVRFCDKHLTKILGGAQLLKLAPWDRTRSNTKELPSWCVFRTRSDLNQRRASSSTRHSLLVHELWLQHQELQ